MGLNGVLRTEGDGSLKKRGEEEDVLLEKDVAASSSR